MILLVSCYQGICTCNFKLLVCFQTSVTGTTSLMHSV
uniref:Uncharacterized protein n=1 Tax=Rhizophora mucronata TaxID=61149 RepID=A0A2P2MX61_RHIMU